MKILIAGASGFIGSQLVAFWQKRGHEVFALKRKGSPLNLPGPFWDVESGEVGDLEGYQVIVNLCGESIFSRWTKNKKRRIEESRVKSTELLARTINTLKKPPQVFVSTSAVGYYGIRGDEAVDESFSSQEGFLAEVCRKWEEAANEVDTRDVRTIILRFGVVLHPTGGVLKTMLPAFKMGFGGKVGSGKQWMSWIHIDDLLYMINFLVFESHIRGPINVVSPYPARNETFTKILARVLKRPCIFPLPSWMCKLLFGKEMAEEVLLSGVKVLPKRVLEAHYSFRYPELEKALQSLIS